MTVIHLSRSWSDGSVLLLIMTMLGVLPISPGDQAGRLAHSAGTPLLVVFNTNPDPRVGPSDRVVDSGCPCQPTCEVWQANSFRQ